MAPKADFRPFQIAALSAGVYSPGDPGRYGPIVGALTNNDRFMVTADFDAYFASQRRVEDSGAQRDPQPQEPARRDAGHDHLRGRARDHDQKAAPQVDGCRVQRGRRAREQPIDERDEDRRAAAGDQTSDHGEREHRPRGS